MKNPLPPSALIAVAVVAVIALLGTGFYIMKGSEPIALPAKPNQSASKLKAIQAMYGDKTGGAKTGAPAPADSK
jgi:hypothetical protein